MRIELDLRLHNLKYRIDVIQKIRLKYPYTGQKHFLAHVPAASAALSPPSLSTPKVSFLHSSERSGAHDEVTMKKTRSNTLCVAQKAQRV